MAYVLDHPILLFKPVSDFLVDVSGVFFKFLNCVRFYSLDLDPLPA